MIVCEWGLIYWDMCMHIRISKNLKRLLCSCCRMGLRMPEMKSRRKPRERKGKPDCMENWGKTEKIPSIFLSVKRLSNLFCPFCVSYLWTRWMALRLGLLFRQMWAQDTKECWDANPHLYLRKVESPTCFALPNQQGHCPNRSYTLLSSRRFPQAPNRHNGLRKAPI
jgi:hypothetical protein